MKKTIMTLGMVLASSSAFAATVQDVNKTVIQQMPYQVEVCGQQHYSGDKTGDTLSGAIIGGIIGHQIGNGKDRKNNRNIGAVLGGIVGHNNSTATGGSRQVCNIETRYNESRVEVYSHSIVTFMHNGRQYSVRFQK